MVRVLNKKQLTSSKIKSIILMEVNGKGDAYFEL